MQSKAKTVEEYLASLPEDRRVAVETVRKAIRKNLDKGYEEGMQYGMIGYYVPLRLYPAGYHCDPKQGLPFAALASQKNHLAFYMMSLGDPREQAWFEGAWKATGRRLDMGKCCVRFKKLADAAVDVIGEAVKRMPAKAYIEFYESARAEAAAGKDARAAKAAAKKAPARASAARASRVEKGAPEAAAKKPAAKKPAARKPAAKKSARRSGG